MKNTTSAKEILGQLKNRKQFLQTSEKSRGDKRSFFFLKNTIFSMAIFWEKQFSNEKKHKKEIKKTNFFGKGWREWFFSKHEEITRKWDLDKIVFGARAIFANNIVFQHKKGEGIFQEVQNF